MRLICRRWCEAVLMVAPGAELAHVLRCGLGGHDPPLRHEGLGGVLASLRALLPVPQ